MQSAACGHNGMHGACAPHAYGACTWHAHGIGMDGLRVGTPPLLSEPPPPLSTEQALLDKQAALPERSMGQAGPEAAAPAAAASVAGGTVAADALGAASAGGGEGVQVVPCHSIAVQAPRPTGPALHVHMRTACTCALHGCMLTACPPPAAPPPPPLSLAGAARVVLPSLEGADARPGLPHGWALLQQGRARGVARVQGQHQPCHRGSARLAGAVHPLACGCMHAACMHTCCMHIRCTRLHVPRNPNSPQP